MLYEIPAIHFEAMVNTILAAGRIKLGKSLIKLSKIVVIVLHWNVSSSFLYQTYVNN